MRKESDDIGSSQDGEPEKWRASLQLHLENRARADELRIGFRSNLAAVVLLSLAPVCLLLTRSASLAVEMLVIAIVDICCAYLITIMYFAMEEVASHFHTLNESRKKLIVDYLPELPKSEHVEFIKWIESPVYRKTRDRLEVVGALFALSVITNVIWAVVRVYAL